MIPSQPDTEELIEQAARGDRAAGEQLLPRHQKRLYRMVTLRLEHRLRARVAPSDVVQDVLIEANNKLSDYLRERPLPFYPWLRQLAWDQLIELHRRHIRAQKRSVSREEPDVLILPDESAVQLASKLADLSSSPSHKLLREELRGRVRLALSQLPPLDQEVLVLRHLEQMSTAETAAVLGITPGAVKTRNLRALQRLRKLFDLDPEENGP